MKWLRIAAAIAVVAIAGWALNRFCLEAWRCNNTVSQAERATVASFDLAAGSLTVKARTRTYAERLLPCLEHCPAAQRVEALVVLAADYRMLNDLPRAVAAYRESLKIDFRPEIYFNLAEVEYELGERDAATRHFAVVMAVAPFMIDYSPGAQAFMTANNIPTDVLPAVLAAVPAMRQALMNGERP
jgi:tetratricopeptide (TPR) repeat protein